MMTCCILLLERHAHVMLTVGMFEMTCTVHDARLSGINLSFAAFTLHMGIDTSRERVHAWYRM
jgi:hypothetical protein